MKRIEKYGFSFATTEELREYEDDVWDLRNYPDGSPAARAANLKMWNKWGRRMGFPHPDAEKDDE